MKKRAMAVRIIAIFLCALMVLSVVAIALTRVFAAEDAAASPDTGSSKIWIIFAAAGLIALVVAIVTIISTKTPGRKD
ncbi:MAG: surface glycoprotein [Clostridia bacterium]|nr:surface glycoprotein [Clostridia bacterium]